MLSRQIFDVDHLVAGKIPTGDDRCRFDFNILEEKIKELIADRLGDENRLMYAPMSTQLQLSSVPILLKESLEPNALSGKLRVQQPLHPPSLLPCQSTSHGHQLSTSMAG